MLVFGGGGWRGVSLRAHEHNELYEVEIGVGEYPNPSVRRFLVRRDQVQVRTYQGAGRWHINVTIAGREYAGNGAHSGFATEAEALASVFA